MKNCPQCQAQFEVTDADRAFYDKISPVIAEKKYAIPEPSLCPSCRMQQRLLFRNFFNLYHRKCDLSGKQMISMYHQDYPGPVYQTHEWWSDKWDPISFGFEPDASKTIMEQLMVLHQTVPRMSIANNNCENTDYCNLSMESRNCYLVFGNVFNEDCYFGHIVWQSKNCFDCLYTYRSEYCYECVDCVQSYNLAFSQSCDNCSDSQFLLNCNSCRNCFGCVGLKNKEYHIFNQAYSREEYDSKMADFNRGHRKIIEFAKKRVEELKGKEIVKYFHGFNCENISGDYLYNCKNVFNSYDAKNCEDSRYCATVESFYHCHDGNYSPAKTEWSYNVVAVDGYSLRNCHNVLNASANMTYCDNCYASKDCFACVGLKNKQYCVFNKQYSKEAYENLVAKLTEYMKETGEWGEFFPSDLSPFSYNETMAQEYFPLSKEEAIAQGFKWRDEQPVERYEGQVWDFPEDIKDVPDDILEKKLFCSVTGKPYKIIKQELDFYRRMHLPIPLRCPDQRHKDRMKLRNPRRLWDRKCDNCEKEIQTTYSPDRPEKVYCEQCYLSEVY